MGAFFSLIACLLVCGEASAQYHFDTWTTDNGLPQNGVRQIAQTPDGYLWFTTFDGLVRFDGVRFTVQLRQYHRHRQQPVHQPPRRRRRHALRGDDGRRHAERESDSVFSSYDSGQVPGHYSSR